MIGMNRKTLKTLEFDKIIDILTDLASSEGAKELCRTLQAETTIGKLCRMPAQNRPF